MTTQLLNNGQYIKTICTVGPSISSYDSITEVIKNGMCIARFNMSHGDKDDHINIYNNISKASKALQHNIGIMIDLQGPKIRLNKFVNNKANLINDDIFYLDNNESLGDNNRCSTSYKLLYQCININDYIYLDDGKIILKVIKLNDDIIKTRIIKGGAISNHKGINVPNANNKLSVLSEKDINDIKWAFNSIKVDMVAVSFVRDKNDINIIKNTFKELNIKSPIISKIEKPEAIKNIKDIVKMSDAIMVARGDLGIEADILSVPIYQKNIIKLTQKYNKPVIVATHMLESMNNCILPTRAEISDIANATLDGTYATMLSSESSVGKYPLEATRTMTDVNYTTYTNALYKKSYTYNNKNINNIYQISQKHNINNIVLFNSDINNILLWSHNAKVEFNIIPCVNNNTEYGYYALLKGIKQIIIIDSTINSSDNIGNLINEQYNHLSKNIIINCTNNEYTINN